MIEVFGWGSTYLGSVTNFGEAKRLQRDTLPDDLKPLYAGVGYHGDPLFYAEMLTPELLEKYPSMKPAD